MNFCFESPLEAPVIYSVWVKPRDTLPYFLDRYSKGTGCRIESGMTFSSSMWTHLKAELEKIGYTAQRGGVRATRLLPLSAEKRRCDIIGKNSLKEDVVPLAIRQKNDDHIKVKQYITDSKGHKVAAILDIKELERINDLLEDLLDLKTIEDRIAEPAEDYEAYSRKRKYRLHV